MALSFQPEHLRLAQLFHEEWMRVSPEQRREMLRRFRPDELHTLRLFVDDALRERSLAGDTAAAAVIAGEAATVEQARGSRRRRLP